MCEDYPCCGHDQGECTETYVDPQPYVDAYGRRQNLQTAEPGVKLNYSPREEY